MEQVLQGLIWKYVVVYLDNVVIFSRTQEGHVEHLAEVFHRFEQHNLKLKPRKYEIIWPEVKCLRHVVSTAGVATDLDLIDKVKAWDPPKTQKEVRAFLMLTGYYRAYVPEYGKIAKPLMHLVDAGAEVNWTPACQRAFEELKRRLITVPILSYPTRWTPSCWTHVRAMPQCQGEHEHVIAYCSRALLKEERNYCVTRKELLAVVHFVKAY